MVFNYQDFTVTLSSFLGHEVFQDHKNYLTDLQIKLQTVCFFLKNK